MSTAALPVPADDARMSLMEHLTELRDRLIKIVLAVAIGMVVAFLLYDRIFDFLLEPYKDVANEGNDLPRRGQPDPTDPLEGFGVRMKLAGYGGVVLAMPVILWQLWRFVTPGLLRARAAVRHPVRGERARRCSCSGPASRTTRCRRALDFLIDIGGDDLVTAFAPGKYFTLITYMMLAFGIGFEFPILLVFLQMAGDPDVATPAQLAGATPSSASACSSP